jgi:site-specific DNA-methyltransferase (adenine-specific)
METKKKAGNNRTLTLQPEEIAPLKKQLITESNITGSTDIVNKTLNGDIFKMIKYIPDNFADLIIIDPPYNLSKNFNGMKFNSRSDDNYDEYLATWFPEVCKKLRSNGSLYMCGDWKCTSSLQRAIEKELTILNRITWQREKGRGAKSNWKNGMEDIWFAVKNPNDYYFNVEAANQKIGTKAKMEISDLLTPLTFGTILVFLFGQCQRTLIIQHKNRKNYMQNLFLHLQKRML